MQTTIETPNVIYEKHGQVAYITLNRPQCLNAMNLCMHEELALIWNDFEADDKIRIGILSGAGEKAFSVGQDLKELASHQQAGTSSESSFGSRGKPGWPRLTERFDRIKPLIAKVHGYTLGGGFELALACDIIIAAKNTIFSLPEARLGLIAGAGGIFRLTRQIPYRIALGYLITGRSMTATTAYSLGLVNEVVDFEQLNACVESWTQDILHCAPLSIRAIKESSSKSATVTIEEAFSMRYTWEEARKASFDAREGPRAFVEKRLPKWQDR